MLRLTYFNRDKRAGNFSIEEIFSTIKRNLPKDILVSSYEHDATDSRVRSVLKARQYQGDVNHITGDVNYLAIGLDKNKTILTIHDLGHIVNTLKGFKLSVYKLFWYYLPLKRVRYVTVVSEFTKKTLMEYFNVPEEKIKVIYNPCSSIFQYSPKEFNEECPVILQIGSGETKNIDNLIEAVKGLKVKLLLVRKPDSFIRERLEKFNIAYEWKYQLSESEIYECYKSCDIVFFASHYEGFGMPIIEGNATGRVVITANNSSLPEIADKAALVVNSANFIEIKEAIEYIVASKELRALLIESGLQNVRRFQVESIVKQYVELYTEIKNTI